VTPRASPFADGAPSSERDRALARSALGGSRAALEELVRDHQPWIYNLALRTLWNREDAEDATQEILLRIVTRLSSFRGESAFSTWAYRIAVNHLLDRKRSKSERIVTGFECYARALEETPDAEAAPTPEEDLLAQEAKIGCMTGMLLCLDRTQRLVFVLGEIFGASDAVGSEILETSRENFRQILSRARRQLQAFLQGHCGLFDAANPCRCARKTRGFVASGIVDPSSLQFAALQVARVAEVAPERAHALDALAESGPGRLFRDHPFQSPPDVASRLDALLRGGPLRVLLDLD
jgi:RNA polymerase sigma factor (sigma-70 family)